MHKQGDAMAPTGQALTQGIENFDFIARGSAWLATQDAQKALGVVFRAAPSAQSFCKTAAKDLLAMMGQSKSVAYFEDQPLVLPWRTIRQNLVHGCEISHDSGMVDAILDALQLSAQAHRRPDGLNAQQRLALALARAMLQAPDLLVISGLAQHPAITTLGAFVALEARLAHITGCRRLHLASSPDEVRLFCDGYLCLN